MSAIDIQTQIDNTDYWDLRVLHLVALAFGDEVELHYENYPEGKYILRFAGCYKVVFEHPICFSKAIPIAEMTKPQILFFLQEIAVSEEVIQGKPLYVCTINMAAMTLNITCENITLTKDIPGGV